METAIIAAFCALLLAQAPCLLVVCAMLGADGARR